MSANPPPLTPTPLSGRKKVLWLAGAAAFVLVLTLIVHSRLANPPAGANFRRAGNNALAVGVARVTSGDVPITIDSLGTVTPLATVTVHPQVTGPLIKIAFAEGQVVKAGDLLAVDRSAPIPGGARPVTRSAATRPGAAGQCARRSDALQGRCWRRTRWPSKPMRPSRPRCSRMRPRWRAMKPRSRRRVSI